MSNLHVTICLWATSKFLCFSLFLSLSHAVCAFVYTRAHACRSCVPDLPSRHTPCARGGGGAGARVLSRAHKMRGPALINLNDCMACDYSDLCCSGMACDYSDLCCSGSWQRDLLEKGSYASYTISLHKNPQNHNVSTAVHRKLLLQGRAPCLQHMVQLGGPRYSNMYVMNVVN